MPLGAMDVYSAGFDARCMAVGGSARPVAEPGLRGLVPRGRRSRALILVTDDRAYERLAEMLPRLRGLVRILGPASRCAALLDEHPEWAVDRATAMARPDLLGLPPVALPGGLGLRPVRRLPDDPVEGVALEQAVALVEQAAPSEHEPPRALTAYMRSLPPTYRLLAAVDAQGVVRATSGSAVLGDQATVLFVNTHPDWQRRGAGGAMTVAALRSARGEGAVQASLDSSRAGLRLYERLGFEVVASVGRYSSRD